MNMQDFNLLVDKYEAAGFNPAVTYVMGVDSEDVRAIIAKYLRRHMNTGGKFPHDRMMEEIDDLLPDGALP